MRFLICGLGSIGRRHLRNLLALGEQDLVLLRTGKSTLPDEELAGFPTETDLEKALDRWSPDAVIIANPTSRHLETAIPAARAGCDLLIEKPISHSLAGIDDLICALEDGAAKVLVGFQFRFHPGLQKVKAWLEEDAIGEPIGARAHWGEYLPAWHPWEDYRTSYAARPELGGGVILTLCHPFDYLRWLLGEADVAHAVAKRSGTLRIPVEDMAEVLLCFRSGVLGSVHMDYNQRPTSHWLEIIGSEGTVRWDQRTGEARLWHAGLGDWTIFQPPEGFERNWMFRDEMAHFLEVVRGQKEPVCSLTDGIRALELALEARNKGGAGYGS